jgi:hypothetical protein
MENNQLVGRTIIFDDAYTGVERYGRIIQTSGTDGTIRIIRKEEAGLNPIRWKPIADPRIDEITGGTGQIN